MAKIKVTLEEIYDILQEISEEKINNPLSESKENFLKYSEENFQEFCKTLEINYLKNLSKRLTGKGMMTKRRDLYEHIIKTVDIAFNSRDAHVKVNKESSNVATDILKDVSDAIKLVKPVVNSIKENNLIDENVKIRVSNEFSLFENMPITPVHKFNIKGKSNIELTTLLAVIVRTDNDIDMPVAVGKLEKSDSDYHFVAQKRHIDYELFKSKKKFKIYLFNKDCENDIQRAVCDDFDGFEGTVYSSDVQITFKEVIKETRPLCIDFGTSNTTVGSYGLIDKDNNKLEFVEFETGVDSKLSKLYPTIVYVKKCPVVESEPVQYMFGYEAKNKVVECNYDTEATVFFEIKRWITSLEAEEVIQDEEGNTRKVKRREIVKAYLCDVIDKAETFFKVKFQLIHFSAPVKLKAVFIEELKKIFYDEYTIYGMNNSLDEGKAIVYEYVQEEINKALGEKDNNSSDNKTDDNKRKMLILDCGGGTTDLASCEYDFDVDNNEIFNTLKLSTQFENGNANFGGNNITYRILQLLKIKMVKSFYPNDFEEDVNILIPYKEENILDVIDRNAKNQNYPIVGDIYKKFDEEYAKAEKWIPTRFADSDFYKKESKRNYYYLWQLAESIKIEFYKHTNLATYYIADSTISTRKIEGFYLYRYDAEIDEIKESSDIPTVELTNNEIKRVIYADIYSVMHNLFSNINLLDYNRFKLSGQSCKITLFQELLKEFITGQMLRKTNLGTSVDSENLKLCCLNGCIIYRKAVDRSEISSDGESNNIAKPIYNIRYECSPVDEFMYDSINKISNILPVTIKTDSVVMFIESQQGEKMRRVEFRLNRKETKNITSSDLRKLIEKYSQISSDELDEIIKEIEEHNFTQTNNQGIIIFAIPSKNGYGFNIYQVKKVYNEKESNYTYSIPKDYDKPIYENYEDVTVSFFDGKK